MKRYNPRRKYHRLPRKGKSNAQTVGWLIIVFVTIAVWWRLGVKL